MERKPPGSREFRNQMHREVYLNADRLGSVASNTRCCPFFVTIKKDSRQHKQEEKNMNAWNNFNGGNWENEINVRDFIQKNYTPYDGDGAGSGYRTHDCAA